MPVAWVMLAAWFGLQIFSGYAMMGGEAGVAYWAHAGGFVAGLVLTLPAWLRRGAGDYWQATRGRPPHPASDFEAARSNIPRTSCSAS